MIGDKSITTKVVYLTCTVVIAAWCALSLSGEDTGVSAPAFYDPGPVRGDAPKLYVFPLKGESFSVPLPFQLGAFAASPDGTVLYGARFFDPSGRNTGLYKIEFGPARATKIAGSEGLASVYGIGASSTKIILSAGYLSGARLVSRCGLYELELSAGGVHKIVDNTDCTYLSAWGSISLSPDSERLIAVRKHRLELIDTQAGTIQTLGDGFYYAAWSPDGRWIAALDTEHTVLINALALSQRRVLPKSEVIWSPDSRSILASRSAMLCGPDFGTLRLIDIESGRTSIIRSSTCRINQLVFGWVNVEAVH